jgi:PAS domain S-box-containing protein
MKQTDSLRAIVELGPGDHLCCIYQTEAEHRAVLTPFLRQGLERGEKVLYIVDDRTAEEILDYLRDDGLDVEPYLDRGQLAILTRHDAYVRGGSFDPDAMIALLEDETEQALAEGYTALRVTGEMSWALRGLPGSERLIEYEAKLNQFFVDRQCLAVCQYDRRRFESEVLLDVLRTHPIAVIGTQIYENFYYVPPEELLGQTSTEAAFQRWLENLAERKRREKVEKELTQRIEAGLRAGNLAWWEMELPSGKVIFDDHKAKMLGYTPERFRMYEDFTGLLHPDDHDAAMQAMCNHLDGEAENYEAEYRIKTYSGAYKWFRDIGGVTEQNEATGYIRVVGIVEDITERKRAEEALWERVKELACLYAVNRDLQEATSVDSVCRRVVDHLTSAMQFPEIAVPVIEVDGKRFTSDKYSEALSHSLRAAIKVAGEARGQVSVYYLEERPFLLPHEQDLLNGVAEALSIWLERTRAEEALKEYSERLEEMVEERTRKLREAQEQLIRQERLAALGQLAGGVGHELRNPLGAIKNAVYFLHMALAPQAPDPEVQETLEILEQEVARSERITGELLDFARARPPSRQEADLNQIVQETLSRIEIPLGVEVVTRLAADLPRILADPGQLDQVFDNLIHNAVQAMPEGGRLTMSTRRESEGWVAASIVDTGVGIPRENREKIFEPLFTTRAKGIGLGLAIVQTLVEGHGGTIEVGSEVGEGTTFTIRLPVE